jgi:hypothetical protein
VSIPVGWTDDMNIQIAPDRTLDQLVDIVLQAAMRQDDSATTIAALQGTERPNRASVQRGYKNQTSVPVGTSCFAISGGNMITIRQELPSWGFANSTEAIWV